jgi:glycosyltransferase involved in cell wall biosynthesis
MGLAVTDYRKQKVFSICISRSEGGLEFCVVKFAKKLQDEGHKSIVICTADCLIHKKSLAANLPVLLVKKTKVPFSVFFQILKYIRSERPETLITHRSSGMKRSAIYKTFFPHLRIISFLHTIVRYKKKDWLHRYLYSKIDKFVVFSEIQKQNACEYLPVDEGRLDIMPHTVDTNAYRPELQEFQTGGRLNSRPMTIGCVGRFDLKKGQMELIEAVGALARKNLPLKLVFIGKDTVNEEGQRAACEAKVRELKLEPYVTFLDPMNDLTEAYRSFDIFVMPSQEETFGMVLIEAMASGCLCVARRAGGPIEILDNGRSGVLVDPNSPRSFEIVMEEILKNPDGFSGLRTAARQRAIDVYSDANYRSTLSRIVSETERPLEL